MTKKAKRIVTKVAKTGAWAVSDIFFLALKAVATVLMIVLTTGAVFSAIFLIYLRTNVATELTIEPGLFHMMESSVIYAIDPETGEEIELVTLQWTEFRHNVTLDEVPEHLIQALVAIEDHRFFRHNGVDWYRTAGAFMNMFLSMRDTFGGSTITQQLIKNLTQEDDITVQRKLQEIFRALDFERQFSKEEILEMYLNIVYFGHGRFGIGAAAHFYFGKDVSELTLAESAAIIGITNNPSRFSPYANRAANKERQETILRRMYQLEKITQAELRAAINEPLNFQRGEEEVVTRRIYTWFEEAIIRDIVRDLGEQRGISPQLATRYLYTSGLRIMSTIDLNMQAIVDEVFQNPENLPTVTGSTQPLQSGIVIADPHTGAIRALSGGTGTKSSNMLFNRATMARRPPGSALKPVSVFAPAIEMGHITPNTRYNDTYNTELRGTNWFPRNADRTHRGIVDVRTALRLSLNTVPAIILDEITPTAGFNFMRDALGFELSPADEDYAPLAAGQLTNGATVREMASAFTTFPNGGERMELRTYSRIYRRNGEIFLDNPPRGVQAMSENNANMMTSMLIDAVTNGTGGLANIGGGMPTAGKTGTSTDSMDRWFVGFTPHYVAAVWTGFDRPTRMRSEGNPAARIFRSVMAPIHADLPSAQFTQPTIVDRPSTMGVQAASYTVTLLDVMGNTIMVHNHTGTLGSTVTVNAPHLDNYLIVGESSATITLSTDPNRNNIVFIYSWIGEQAEDPTDPDAPIDDDIFTFPPPDTTPGTPDIPPGTPGAPDIPPGTPGTPGYIPGQPPANVPPSDGDPPPQDDIFFFMPPPPEPPPPEREPHDTPDE